MIRRCVLPIALLISISGCEALARADDAAVKRPNIVVIIVDDLGYEDLSVHGSRVVKTPHIDGLAAGGIRMTNGYVSAPICAPTRAGLMTGRYQWRFGYVNFTWTLALQIRKDLGVPTDEVFLTRPLKAAGYVTGAIGKWHLGANEKYRPHNRGFDEFFGFLPGGHDYFRWNTVESGPIYRDNRKTEGDAYLTDAFSDEAAAFIRQHKDEKFFLYVAYNAVHPPLQVPPPYTEKLGAIADERRRNMIGMIHALDDGVGRILAALRETGLERNTVVFFVNDNGGTKLASNKPLSGYKVSLWEGGIRVPFIVRWPARLPAGKIYDQPVISLDIMPTAVAAAGGQLPADRIIDGVNLVPYLAGEKTGAPHEHLIWRAATHETYAVRSGNWKLLHMFKGKPQLFDLSADIAEQNDLAAQHPDRVASLCKAYEEWKAQMVEPLF